MSAMSRTLIGVIASLILLFPCFSVAAEDSEENLSEEMKLTASESKQTVEDLLIYWEEKDIFVQSPTRSEKKISQVAENVEVVTAKDIEEMNAHTVAEVLDRVTGMFIDFQGHDFGSSSILHIQGSEAIHVLVLVDGIAWNFLGGGNAETNSIPVKIIKRIEIIKGPASSAWGSSLGGVVNIITKDAGDNPIPSGTITGSYGEGNSQDYSGEVFGKVGRVGYYLFAGRRASDGLSDSRYFRDNSLYMKLTAPVSNSVKVGVTAGYSEPHMNFGESPSADLSLTGNSRTFFVTGNLEASLTRELVLKASIYNFAQNFTQKNDILGLGLLPGNAGDLFQTNIFDEDTTGGNVKLVWTHGIHTAVLGTDISHGTEDETIEAGQVLQNAYGVPGTSAFTPTIDKWAVFVNDTVTLGTFSVTPGIRYDHNNVSGSFTSPSVGITYKICEHTILRASAARGFTIPPLSYTAGGALLLSPNPALQPEKVWSYQAGIESSMTKYLWLKMTAFYHHLTDAFVKVRESPATRNKIFINDGSVNRKGAEVEAETAPFHGVSAKAGFALVHINSSQADEVTVNYEYNVGLKYDDKKSFYALLLGHYVWWNLPADFMAKYNGFLWDLNLSKKIFRTGSTQAELFVTGHNLFDGSQYSSEDQQNPGRWVEAGLRLRF